MNNIIHIDLIYNVNFTLLIQYRLIIFLFLKQNREKREINYLLHVHILHSFMYRTILENFILIYLTFY